MKRVLIGLGIFAVVAFLAYRFFFAKERFVSVLVFSKTEQFRHESIEAGQIAIMELGKKHGFRVDTTENAEMFQEDILKDYNVVIFLNTTGNILNEAQQLEFNRFIQAGGGFVGIHAAADTEYDWPWYGRLVGAYFSSHPNDPNVFGAGIDRIDKTHISTKHLPDRWETTDEWYNYKDIQSHINVLLNLDESTYEGGTNGENHPIAWYHEFDGGRSWYTGKGHTPETFSSPDFLKHLLGGINYAAGPAVRVNFNNANVAPEENRFEKIVLEAGLNEPMELEMLPDGKLIYIQRHGEIKIYDPEVEGTTEIQKLEVFSELEDGLLGLALDPDFENNRWIYLFHSDPTESEQHVSRFTMAENYRSLDMDSKKLLLKIATQRDECCHSAGSIEFGPNGNLFIATGDNTNPHASDGFSPSDEQPGRSPWDAQKSAANTNDLRGKVLRIKPEADGSYSIPEGNLFSNKEEGRPEIYVMGCRNPFRIAVDQRNGWLYWGDVGPDAGTDSLGRGPKGHDEVNQARQAGFFGWPYFIADNKPYNKYDFATQVSYDPHDQEKPINQSPNNTGAQNLPPAQPAYIYYPYGASDEFPLVGDGGRNAMAGPVFYKEDYPENDGRFPDYYDGKLFTYDWMRGWIMNVTMDENGDFVRMDRFLPSFKFSNPTDIIFGPNGDMYLLEYGTVWFSENPDARLVHLKYTAGNRKPLAQMAASKTVGAAPLEVAFTSESKDFDGDALSYAWYYGDSDKPQSTEENPTFTFDKAGKYEVTLVVADPSGEQSTSKTEILVGNELPEIKWDFVGNRSFYWDNQKLAYEVSVSDKEDGRLGSGISPNQVVVSIDHLERGYDANMSALGHKAMQEASGFALGKQLMDGSDCATCHQMDVASVGPNYLEIAKKYVGDAKAEVYLASKIINGGGGVWGETVMAAHPQLSQSEAQQMAKYILSLSSDAPLATMPAKGAYTFNQHQSGNTEGKYILTASYRDKGGDQIGPLTAREVVVLRYPKMLAAEYSEILKAQKFKVDPEMSQGMFKEEMELVIGMSDGVVTYNQIDFTGVEAIRFEIAKAGPFFSGGTMSIHLDDPDSEAVVELPIKTNLADFGMEEIETNLPGVEGVHDFYVKFKNDGEKPVTALISMYFSNTPLGDSM